MLLYQDPAALNPRRVRVFLAEKALPYDTVEISIASRANLSAEYLIKNPLGLLPVLELADGRVLRESVAICRYLEELHPEPNLLGADAWERATIEQWNRHAELELLMPMAQIFRNEHRFWQGRIPQSPEYAGILRELVGRRFAWIDSELAHREFIAGDRFTIADITALCGIDFGKLSKIRIDPAVTPHLARWHQAVSARPSAAL
jgi:glutathione S-transferase